MSENSNQYSGEFVLTSNGNIDFGEISSDIAKIIRRQAGKIRLRIGKQINGEKDNYGEAHINRKSRLNQLNDIGYADARNAAEDIAAHYDEIMKTESACYFVIQTMRPPISALNRIQKIRAKISMT